MWSWYTGAGLTVVERIDRVDHKLQQAVSKLCVALPRMRGRASVGLFAALSGTCATAAAADAAAAANSATASSLPGRRDASARTRRTAHARFAIVDRVRMLLEHTTPFQHSVESLTIANARLCIARGVLRDNYYSVGLVRGNCLTQIGTEIFFFLGISMQEFTYDLSHSEENSCYVHCFIRVPVPLMGRECEKQRNS